MSPPGPGSDFDDGDVFERLGGARDARGQIEIEQEILAEGFFRRETMAADDLAQRRQVIDLRHYFAGTSAGAVADRRAASVSAATRLDGSAVPVPAISNAVPWSGDVRTNGKPERHVHGVIERQRLDRDQCLVVIHAERDVVGRPRPLMKHGVGRQRSDRVDAFGL